MFYIFFLYVSWYGPRIVGATVNRCRPDVGVSVAGLALGVGVSVGGLALGVGVSVAGLVLGVGVTLHRCTTGCTGVVWPWAPVKVTACFHAAWLLVLQVDFSRVYYLWSKCGIIEVKFHRIRATRDVERFLLEGVVYELSRLIIFIYAVFNSQYLPNNILRHEALKQVKKVGAVPNLWPQWYKKNYSKISVVQF